MAGISLTQAQTKLDSWIAAEAAVADSQSYNIAGRSLTRANLAEIGDRVEYWDRQVKRLTRGGIRVRGVTPV